MQGEYGDLAAGCVFGSTIDTLCLFLQLLTELEDFQQIFLNLLRFKRQCCIHTYHLVVKELVCIAVMPWTGIRERFAIFFSVSLKRIALLSTVTRLQVP
jgi:hypothetical protein